MYRRLFRKLATCAGILMLVSCGSSPPPTQVAEDLGFSYLVATDDSPMIIATGSEFQVTTNNCGSRVSAKESFTRSREFNIALETEFSQSVRGQLGGSILVADAEIEAEVSASLGLQVGSSETVQTERQIETPADSITTVTLQWEEIWQAGTVSIRRVDGSTIGDVPFRVLSTMRLTQKRIKTEPCNSFPTDTPPPTSTPTPTATPSPTSTPTLTITPSPTATPTHIPTTVPTRVLGPAPTQPQFPADHILDDFEGYGNDAILQSAYSINAAWDKNVGHLSLALPPNVGTGNRSAAFYYEIRNPAPDDYAGFDRSFSKEDWQPYSMLHVWVKSDGSPRDLVIQFGEDSGEVWRYRTNLSTFAIRDFRLPLNDDTFQLADWSSYQNGRIDLGAIEYYGFHVGNGGNGSGTVYIDDISLE